MNRSARLLPQPRTHARQSPSRTPWLSAAAVPLPPGVGSSLHVERRLAGAGSGVAQAAAVTSAVSFGAALGTSLNAMGEVATSMLIGALAYRRGILTPQVLMSVSALTVNIFIPALLCGKVAMIAAGMQALGLTKWLPLVLACALIQIGVQFFLSGRLLRFVARVAPDSAKGRVMRLAMMFPNSAMPLVFVQAIFRGRGDILLLAEGAIAFYLIGWSSTFWTAGFSLLQGAPGEEGSEPTSGVKLGADSVAASESRRPDLLQRLRRDVGRVLSPPVCGVLTGLVFGLVPLLRWLVVPHGGRLSPPPLGFLFYGLENLGRAAIPSSQVVLAGSLARSLDRACRGEGCEADVYRWRARDLISVVAARVLLGPVFCGLGLCWLLRALGLLSAAPGVDRVLAFVLILESAMPSAQNAIVIPNLLGHQKMAAAMAQLLLFVYIVALPAASIWLAVGLHW
eukprot:CAMPEP_0183422684 /NCGR_PEP_ID=MMETSP0370-20130417/27972_1 /TAXON_ID=268820 /ORGANISM="Peridinium aciculiferum, Strain PAER-2" /LENGTH=453 /DNA_ID=CAMNT_0025606797 /DNA_START=90 /DNA_END=1448 /DNA_ORIENTATION=+